MNSIHKSFSMLVIAGVMLVAANAHADEKVRVTNFPEVLSPTAPSQLVDLTTNSPCPNPLFSEQNALGLDNQIFADGVRGAFEIPTGKTLVLTKVSQSFGHPNLANHSVFVTLIRASSSTGNAIDVEGIVLSNDGSGTARFSFPTGTHFAAGTTACLIAQDQITLDFIPGVGFAHGFLIDDF
jgi:hypothetical protein